jgi:hypothetical protein
MRFQYRYYGATSVDNSASSTALCFAPDVLRPPTYFVADINRHLSFREAISTLHDVVVADGRYQAPDKTACKAWLAKNETALLTRFQARSEEFRVRQALLLEELKALRARKAAVMKPFRDAEAKFYRYLYMNDRTMWLMLDPIITVHPDRVFFEAFSRDEAGYASLSCSHDGPRTLPQGALISPALTPKSSMSCAAAGAIASPALSSTKKLPWSGRHCIVSAPRSSRSRMIGRLANSGMATTMCWQRWKGMRILFRRWLPNELDDPDRSSRRVHLVESHGWQYRSDLRHDRPGHTVVAHAAAELGTVYFYDDDVVPDFAFR